jgi:tetratricopeptide (TPR) repeat protein
VRCRLLAFSLSVIASAALGLPLGAQDMQYTANGKPVSREVYEAMCLTNESGELLKLNKTDEALQKMLKAVELAPDLPEAQCNLGLTLGRLGKTDEAIEHLRKAISLSPELVLAWLNLGSIYQTTGQTDEALRVFKECLQRFPHNENATKLQSMITILEKELASHPPASVAAKNAGASEDYFSDACTRPSKWAAERMPLRVWFSVGDSVPGFQPAYATVAKEAFHEWGEASKGKVSFTFVEDREYCDITFDWTDDVRKVSQPAEGGEARVFPSNAGIHKASIVILTTDPAPELKLTPALMKIVCLHEIGHTLGLIGHSSNPKDIMYSTIPIAYEGRTLSDRDQATLRHLYSDVVKNASITKLAPQCTLNYEGAAALKAGDAQLAIEKFKQALVIDPDYTLARDNLALAYAAYGSKLENNGKFQNAESMLKQSLLIQERHPKPSQLRLTVQLYAQLLRRMHRVDDAKKLEEKYEIILSQIPAKKN